MKANNGIIFIFLVASTILQRQNLVPNPSFEDFSSCPTYISQLNRAVPWFSPTVGTPDYCNACYVGPSAVSVDVPSNYFGYQLARTGNGYADLCAFANMNAREYIEVKLIDSLRMNKNYCVTFYVSSADSCQLATSRIGTYFSSDSIYSNNAYVLNYIPQVENPFGNIITDAINWTKISGVFTAIGGERFMTIGNFYNNGNTDIITVGNYHWPYAYFYIDDISVFELPQDSTTCFDEVGINETNGEQDISIYPNPAEDKLYVTSYTLLEKEPIEIYNLFGEVIYKSEIRNQKSEFNISALANGIYFLHLKNKERIFYKKFIISR